VVVSQAVRRLPAPQQAFLLAYALGPIAGRLHATLTLRPAELELAIVAATRAFVPSFAPRPGPTDAVDDAREVLRKAMLRKWRKAAEVAAAELAASPPADLTRWQASMNATAVRAAMLVADDLGGSIDALRYIIALPDAKGQALVATSEPVRDLMRFWISNRAAGVRLHAGMTAST